jgi:hypothetical protein
MKMTENIIVRIIEEEINKVDTKILSITFPSVKHLSSLFTPRLENISFVKINNSITINLKNSSFREFFNDWVIRFSEKIAVDDSIEDITGKFNAEIKAIILLGQKEKKLSWESARGLFGELLVIKEMLEDKTYSQIEILNGWHRPSPANHDFDFPEFSLEIKTVSRDSTTVKITSEHQLESIEEKPLKLKCFRIEKVEKSNLDSLGDLYDEIKSMLDQNNLMEFEIKCAEDLFCGYLGPSFMPLDYKFLIIDCSLYNVNQMEFPRVKKSELNSAISKLSYSIDISSFDKFKI